MKQGSPWYSKQNPLETKEKIDKILESSVKAKSKVNNGKSYLVSSYGTPKLADTDHSTFY